jgi:IS605 OrfB family transposase
LVQSHDLIVYEALKIQNLVKNHKLAKSISDASWYQFTQWLNYFSKIYGIVCIAVPPHFTTINCSNCGHRVHKTLSTRTHECPSCKIVLDRDHNAAINILKIYCRLEDIRWRRINSAIAKSTGVVSLRLVSSPSKIWTGKLHFSNKAASSVTIQLS